MALQPRDGERLEFPGADMRQRRREPGMSTWIWLPEHVLDRGSDAAVMGVDGIGQAGRGAELLQREMVEEADAPVP